MNELFRFNSEEGRVRATTLADCVRHLEQVEAAARKYLRQVDTETPDWRTYGGPDVEALRELERVIGGAG